MFRTIVVLVEAIFCLMVLIKLVRFLRQSRRERNILRRCKEVGYDQLTLRERRALHDILGLDREIGSDSYLRG